jgi:valyl-tRNA synthetase
MAKEQDRFAETIQQQVNSCFEIVSAEIDNRRIEYAAASELLRVLNETLALVAPRVPVFGSSLYRDVEEQSLRCIAKTLTKIENMKAGA